MYLRHTTLRKDGKVHRYWRLVRSVRVGRRVIHQARCRATAPTPDTHRRTATNALDRLGIVLPKRMRLDESDLPHVARIA